MSGRRGGVSMSQTRYEGLHDLPALKYKHGAPFKHWKKPPALAALEKPLSAHPDAPSHSSRFYVPDRSTAWTRSSSLVRMRSAPPAMLPGDPCRSPHRRLQERPPGAFTSRTGPCCMTHRRTMASTWLYRHGAILRGIQALAS